MDRDIDELTRELTVKFANQKLMEEFQPEFALEFTLPTEGKLPGAIEKYNVSHYVSTDCTETIKKLQNTLKPLGYTAFATDPEQREDTFSSENDLRHFLKEPRQHNAYIAVDKGEDCSYELDLKDTPHLGLFGRRFIAPGSEIEKLGDNKFRIKPPFEAMVHLKVVRAILKKSAPVQATSGANDKYAPLRSAQTDGTNYRVDTDMIIAKLKQWDALYGINVIAAKQDLVTIEFDRLPEDLDHLCTEIWLFCPAGVVDLAQKDYCGKAAEMRRFATKLRQDHELTLWWD